MCKSEERFVDPLHDVHIIGSDVLLACHTEIAIDTNGFP